jgi:hypothetical protein
VGIICIDTTICAAFTAQLKHAYFPELLQLQWCKGMVFHFIPRYELTAQHGNKVIQDEFAIPHTQMQVLHWLITAKSV